MQKIMTDKDLRLFEQIVSLRQPALKKAMSALLRKKYNTVIETKDYLYAIGTIPIALVAHMDTVFSVPATTVYYDRKKNVMWSPQGLGADDRAGVYCITQLIKKGLRPHIILTTDEEKGCLGALELVIDYPEPFAEINYLIELDRRGSTDCVFYDCDNPDFIKYIEQFGFKKASGSFSDISIIGEDWGIAAVNLSVGYQNEHSVSELLYVDDMISTILTVQKMLQENDIPKFKFIPSSTSFGKWWKGNKYDSLWNWDDNQSDRCDCCHKKYLGYELIPVKKTNDTTGFYCIDCLVDKVDWCDSCQEAYEKNDKPLIDGLHLCQDCYKEYIAGGHKD